MRVKFEKKIRLQNKQIDDEDDYGDVDDDYDENDDCDENERMFARITFSNSLIAGLIKLVKN